MKKLAIILGLLLVPTLVSAYTIERGDTLWKIADKFDTTVQKIVEQNNIKNPDVIYEGSDLIIFEGFGEPMFGGTATGTVGAKYVESPDFQLFTGAAAGDTTLTIDDLEDIYGNNLTMDDIGTIGYARINPDGTSESITFTGLTRNSDGTVTLTGVKTVLAKYPYTQTSGLIRSHSIGSIFRLTNTAAFYDNFANKENDEIIDGDWRFDAFPYFNTSTELPDADGEFATKYYVDTVGAGGFTSVNVSTTLGLEALGSSPETVGINASSTTGMSFDTSGALYQIVSSTRGLDHDSNGIYIKDGGTYIVFDGSGNIDVDATTTPTASKIPVADASSTVDSWVTNYLFGTGIDGDVTISAGETTLTRDMHYNNLTIESGGEIDANGYKIFVAGTLTGADATSIIHNVGNDASGLTPGTTTTAGTLGIGTAGAPGLDAGNANGISNTSGLLVGARGDRGGVGANASSGGGLGGAAGVITTTTQEYNPFLAISGIDYYSTVTSTVRTFNYKINGGTGGGGGASASGGTGGAGGGGGGVVAVFAKTIAGTFHLEATGGAGGNATGAGGGGGGGGGGHIVMFYGSSSATVTTDVSGGAAGTGGSGAQAGTEGNVYLKEL